MVGFVVVYWQLDGEKRLQLFAIENSPMNTEEFLSIFEVNSTEACKEKDRNKYGLPEAECIAKIKSNSSACRKKTAEKFHGKVNKIEKMLLIGNFYTACIFTEKED